MTEAARPESVRSAAAWQAEPWDKGAVPAVGAVAVAVAVSVSMLGAKAEGRVRNQGAAAGDRARRERVMERVPLRARVGDLYQVVQRR